MDRTTLLWTFTLFLGGFILSGALRNATEDSSTGVIVAVQVGALAVVILLVVVVVRKLRGNGK